MVEKETSIPRLFRKKSPIETSRKDKVVKIVDTCSTEKQVEDIIEEEGLEKDSYFDYVAATSFVKNK